MFHKHSNQTGDILGDYNTIIQITGKDGKAIEKTLGELLDRVLKKEQHEKVLLQKRIADLEGEKKKDEKINDLQEKELFQLKSQLAEKEKELENKEQQLSKVYLELNGKDLSQTSALYAKAYDYFIDGNIKMALTTLDRQKMIEEKNALKEKNKEHSKAWIFRARLFQLEQEYEEVGECFEIAIDLHSDWGNCLEAANYFKSVNRFKDAEKFYKYSLSHAQTRDEKAGILNNLAIIFSDINEYEKVEPLYLEVLSIYRILVEENSTVYLPLLSIALNNLAILYNDLKEYEKAELLYKEALGIRRLLVKDDSATYLPWLGMTLHNFANVLRNKNKYEEASSIYEEALSIRRKLAEEKKLNRLSELSMTLLGFGNLKIDKKEYDKAEQLYIEALSVRRKLAEVNPKAYSPDLGLVLNNLANTLMAKNKNKKAELLYKESLKIRRKLAEENPKAFLPDLSMTLHNFAILLMKMGRNDNAEYHYAEALSMRMILVEENPRIYLSWLCMTQISMAGFYQNSKLDKEKSLDLVNEAITNLIPFQEIAFIQNYLNSAYQILSNWGIDKDTCLKEKMEKEL